MWGQWRGEGGGGCLNVGEWAHDMQRVLLVLLGAGCEIAPVPEVELQSSARHSKGPKSTGKLRTLRCAFSKGNVKAVSGCREAFGGGRVGCCSHQTHTNRDAIGVRKMPCENGVAEEAQNTNLNRKAVHTVSEQLKKH